jgi:ketosteroid isomerase-like protein
MAGVSGDSVGERFTAAFSAGDFEVMRGLLAPDLIAWVTDADGEMQRLEGRDDYLGRVEAMDLPAAKFSVELTQAPVPVDGDKVLLMVEVRAERGGQTLHNFAGHLLRIDGEQIAEWWMVDAKPAESDAFWAS